MPDQLPHQSPHQTPQAPEHHRDPVVRGANPIDRYSLALQLIQVYPVIVTGVALVLPLAWLRVLVAVLGLAIGTAWAVIRERGTESADRGPRGGIRSAATQLGPHTIAIPLQTAVDKAPMTTATATTTTESVHGIRVDIWLHSSSGHSHEPIGHRAHHRRSLPQRPPHRAIPQKPKPHHQSHADEPEPDKPGTTPRLSLAPRARG